MGNSFDVCDVMVEGLVMDGEKGDLSVQSAHSCNVMPYIKIVIRRFNSLNIRPPDRPLQ